MKTILHLTDIHFGWEGDDVAGLAARAVCLDGVLTILKDLETPWRPRAICLTGDIGWHGRASDYVAARVWLDALLEICQLSYNELIVCPGNHDVSRAFSESIPRPSTSAEADRALKPPIAEHWERPFSEYIGFCEKVGVAPLSFGKRDCWLIGARCVDGMRFVVVNSAWCCKDDEDERKLWLGYPQLTYLEATDGLPVIDSGGGASPTICLVHHPKDWLHPSEVQVTGQRPNVFDYLAHRCHILLTGHTHGEVRAPDRVGDHAIHFTGGSAFAGAAHFNSFRLIQFVDDKVNDRAFEFIPHSVDRKWQPHQIGSRALFARPLSLSDVQTTGINKGTALRVACRKAALRYLEAKSRLVRQSGRLPESIGLSVSLRISTERDAFDTAGRVIRREDSEVKVPLFDAVRRARRTLLFGDLGTGKSTLASNLVLENFDRSDQSIGVIVPVKALKLSESFSRKDLMSAIDTYIREDVWPEQTELTLESALARNIESLIVFDGIDELSSKMASRFLSQAATLTETWASIQVVATARPVELHGVSYSGWQTVHTVSLNDEEKVAFLKQELIADGVVETEVQDRAVALFRLLKDNISLNQMAGSPLGIRLIYSRLSKGKAESLSLGDMLHDLLLERLEGWQKRDDKPSKFPHFENACPSPESKAVFLAPVAEQVASGRRMHVEEAKAMFHDQAALLSGGVSEHVAAEALEFFSWLGLIVQTDVVDMPLQPLAEMCAAMGWVTKWRDPACAIVPRPDQWRVVSFCASIARRRGWQDTLRARFTEYIETVLKDRNYLPSACYIVVELMDATLAERAVTLFAKIEWRPLTIFYDERIICSRNIARTLVLAGDVGFDWFYKSYLNPRYPTPNAGAGVIAEILGEWALLVRGSLTTDQKAKLVECIEPYLATDEAHFFGILPILSIIVPNTFSPAHRLWLQAKLLDSHRFATLVEEQFCEARQDGELSAIVDGVVSRLCHESLGAARLWLRWHENELPPHGLICLALTSLHRVKYSGRAGEVVREVTAHLGNDRWLRYARWSLFGEGVVVGAGGAQVLYDFGERSLAILGAALLHSLHDGNYVAASETVLARLLEDYKSQGTHWLGANIINSDEMFGAHSGWWRLLLGRIEAFDNGPAMLAECLRSMGPFALPRYPEIRDGFSRVLNGARGGEFKEAVRARLRSMDPRLRRGAAIVLCATCPETEAEAVLVAIRARENARSFDWHEWEALFLTLAFGPSVLSFLRSKASTLGPKGRAMAYVLMRKGGLELDSGQREELLRVLLEVGSWQLSREAAAREVLEEAVTRSLLIECLSPPLTDRARRAAELLLEFHTAKLDEPVEATCILLRYDALSGLRELNQYIERLATEQEFARRIVGAANALAVNGDKLPILGALAGAILGDMPWKDLLWKMFCEDRHVGTSELEDAGMTILEIGIRHPEFGEAIGAAAKECLADPRLVASRWQESFHWMALLADEFGGLVPDALNAAILHGKPIGYSATTALIARLGRVPDGFKRERAARSVPPSSVGNLGQTFGMTELGERLRDYGRDSPEMHPALMAAVQTCLRAPQLSEADLEAIATAGKPGLLISTSLRFLYALPHNPAESIPLLDLAAKWLFADEREPARPLMRIWKAVRDAVIEVGGEQLDKYLEALDQELLTGDIWKMSVARHVLEIRGFLKNDQIGIVFASFADHVGPFHAAVFDLICGWLGENLSDQTGQCLVLAAKDQLAVLNENPLDPSGSVANMWADLLLPVVLWIHQHRSSADADAVFLRGVRTMFESLPTSGSSRNGSPQKAFARLDPLLAKAPVECISGAVQRGVESLEPSVSAFCRLIVALAKRQELTR